MDFRKKPVVIQAMRWDGTYTDCRKIQDYFPNLNTCGISYHQEHNTVQSWRIVTLEGPYTVSPGDWIIRGVKGEYYPCKSDIFEMTYDVPLDWSIDYETYISQLAGISTAACGYWTVGDTISPSYDTVALRDVAALYQKYDGLHKAIVASLAELSQKGMGLPPSVTRAKKLLEDSIDPFKDHGKKQETPQEVRAQTEPSEPSKVGTGGGETHGQGCGTEDQAAKPPSPTRPDTRAGD